MDTDNPRSIDALLAIMARLRDPRLGCPWDREQTFGTIAPYTIEEAYEVADAIDRDDLPDLKDELGDLLFQVVFHARMAEEQGAFDFGGVVAGIVTKMIRRHPHVFAGLTLDSPEARRTSWEEHKARERQAKADPSALAGIGLALPALTRAEKLGKRAARTGFDWPDADGVTDKVHEELEELAAARASAAPARVAEELGDLLFSVANLARHLHVDPEAALRAANRKFEHRFRQMEQRCASSGQPLSSLDEAQREAAWDAVKAEEERP